MNIFQTSAKKNTKNTIDLPIWLSNQIALLTDDYKKPSEQPPSTQVEEVIEWAEATNPDLSNIDFYSAASVATNWKIENRRQQFRSEYKSNNVVYSFKDKWAIVKLTPQDVPSEESLLGVDIGTTAVDMEVPNPYWRKEEEKIIVESYSLRDPNNYPKANITTTRRPTKPDVLDVREITGSNTDRDRYGEPESQIVISKIKEWVSVLRSTYSTILAPENSGMRMNNADVQLTDLHNYLQDPYGLDVHWSEIGGSVENYIKVIEEAENLGWSGGGSYFYMSTAKKALDNLVLYALRHSELDLLENAQQAYQEKASDRFSDWSVQIPDFPAYPDKDDFWIEPDNIQNQPEFEAKEFQGERKFNAEAYEKAEKEYQDILGQYESEFEPYRVATYLYDEIQSAKGRQMQENFRRNKKASEQSKTKIYKIAKNVKEIKEAVSAELLATYIESLHAFKRDNPKLKDKFVDLIENLPSSQKVVKDMSNEEIKILYETVSYVWTKITGKDIIEETHITTAPESLSGVYWMIKNGVLLHGNNHYTIVKQNSQLFQSLLNLNGFALEQYLCSHPNKLINYIIKNGAIRIMADKNRSQIFFQLSEATYAKWGKDKIKKYDFRDKIVKIIDPKTEYKGWNSGVSIRLT